MTAVILTLEKAIEKAISDFTLFLETLSSHLTADQKIRQATLVEINAVHRIKKVAKKLLTAITDFLATREGEVVALLKDHPVSEGTLTAKIKVSERKSIKYKEVVEYYKPLIGVCFDMEPYTPEEFYSMIQMLTKDKKNVSELFNSYAPSVTENLEIL